MFSLLGDYNMSHKPSTAGPRGPLLSDCWRESHTKPPHLASFCEIPLCPGDLIKISRAVSERRRGSWDLEWDRRCPVGDSGRGSAEMSALCLYHIAHWSYCYVELLSLSSMQMAVPEWREAHCHYICLTHSKLPEEAKFFCWSKRLTSFSTRCLKNTLMTRYSSAWFTNFIEDNYPFQSVNFDSIFKAIKCSLVEIFGHLFPFGCWEQVTIGSALSLGQADSASQWDCDGGLMMPHHTDGKRAAPGSWLYRSKTHDDKSRLKLRTWPLWYTAMCIRTKGVWLKFDT